MPKHYQSLEHTGDLGVEVWADSLEELFAHASLALTDTMVEVDQVQAQELWEWEKSALSLEELLVAQLEELIFLFDAKGMVFAKFEIKISDETQLVCKAYGEPLDREKHQFKTELKAVTYHQLKIWKEQDASLKNLWKTKVIFDV